MRIPLLRMSHQGSSHARTLLGINEMVEADFGFRNGTSSSVARIATISGDTL